MEHVFIFVVCGGKEHIDTLHFSLKYLKRFSKNKIWIITDSKRNEIPIIHDEVIDIKTPDSFDHHQASIYLKTGIHKFVPKGKRYCYLDTDVIAMNENVDLIFEEYHTPITFAPDHCTMDQFSAYAVNCECQDVYDNYFKSMEAQLIEIDPMRTSTKSSIVENRKKLIAYYTQHQGLLSKMKLGLKFLLAVNKFKISDQLYFDKKDKTWKDADTNEVFMHHFKWSEISKNAKLKWNPFKRYPVLPDGRSLWTMTCPHLKENIEEKFNIKISTNQFQHWNGGVFLFDDESHEFLNGWFDKTMEIFKDIRWKTRDQGTLIATVWEMGLEAHPMLNKKWNLIADYHNPSLEWISENTVRLSNQESIQPNFIHVYHHFGDKDWKFWNDLMKNLNV